MTRSIEVLEPRYLMSAMLGGAQGYWEQGPAEVYMVESGLAPGDAGAGTSAAQAMALTANNFATVWGEMQAGSTLFLVGQAGDPIEDLPIVLGSGGVDGALKTLSGYDAGGGLPVLKGGFDIQDTTNPPYALRAGVRIESANADYIHVQDLVIEQKYYGVMVKGDGEKHNLSFDNLHVYDAYDGFLLDANNGGLSYVAVTDSTVTRFEKRGVRITNGVKHADFINVNVDAGGAANRGEPFHIGFQITDIGANGVANEYILFQDTVASNGYDDIIQSSYRNGDGYTAEEGNRYITYQGAKAFNNTDGGFDLKSQDTYLIDTVAIGNKYNYRFHQEAFTLDNVLGAWAYHQENPDHGAGLWAGVGAQVTVNQGTFRNNPVGVTVQDPGTQVVLNDTVISRGVGLANENSSYQRVRATEGAQTSQVTFGGQFMEYVSGVSGINPGYADAEDAAQYGWGPADTDQVQWDGLGTAFDAQDPAYAGVGYRAQGEAPTYGNNGQPWTIASLGATRIEAEDFDVVGYYDRFAGNSGNSTYRDTDVDLSDNGLGGTKVTDVLSAEYLTYTVDVQTAGTYDWTLSWSSAAISQGRVALQVLIDGQWVSAGAPLYGVNTGGENQWQTATTDVTLDAGVQTLRIIFTQGGNIDLDWFELELQA